MNLYQFEYKHPEVGCCTAWKWGHDEEDAAKNLFGKKPVKGTVTNKFYVKITEIKITKKTNE